MLPLHTCLHRCFTPALTYRFIIDLRHSSGVGTPVRTTYRENIFSPTMSLHAGRFMMSSMSAPWTVARIRHPHFIAYFIARISSSPPASSTASTCGAMERSIMSMPTAFDSRPSHPSGDRGHTAGPRQTGCDLRTLVHHGHVFRIPMIPRWKVPGSDHAKGSLSGSRRGDHQRIKKLFPDRRCGSTDFAHPFISWAMRMFKDEISGLFYMSDSTTAFP